jgi:hypothetical protein
MDMPTLFRMLVTNHLRFLSLLGGVSEKKMLEPLDENRQTGKDIVAHVTAWQRRQTQWFRTVAQGGIPHSPEPGMTWEDMDQLNERTAQRDRHRTLEEVMAELRASFEEFLLLIQSFSDEELNTAYPFAWGELYQGESSRHLWVSALAGPGYAHYQDHMYDLLLRLEPSQICKPSPEKLASHVGTYTHPSRAPFIFTVVDGELVAHRKGRTFSSIALDETSFAFKDLGLITFDVIRNGTVHTLEWWTRIFVRQK